MGTGRDRPAADLGRSAVIRRRRAAWREERAVDVGVVAEVRPEPVGGRRRRHRGHDVGVGLRRTTQVLGEHGRAGVGHRIGAVLRLALVGIGVAAFQDQGDAADQGDHRQRGDRDDLPARSARAAAARHRGPPHGCFGQLAAATASVRDAAERFRENGRARVGDGIRGVLRLALVGVGVATLEDQRDAADQGDHRERRDRDDLSPLVTARPMAIHGRPPHGCFGQLAAATASVRTAGQLNSTESVELAVNVTPFLKMMLPISGVIGWYVASKLTVAMQPTAIWLRAHGVDVFGVPSAFTW